MRKMLVLLAALLMMAAVALADSTPMPTSTPMPGFGGGGQPIKNPAQISVVTQEDEVALEELMMHANSGSAHYDGIYAWQGVESILSAIDVPEITDVVKGVKSVFKANYEETSVQSLLFQDQGNGLEKIAFENDVIPWGELPAGRYLLRVNFSVSDGNQFYSGSAFAWITV